MPNKNILIDHLLEMHQEFVKVKMLPDEFKDKELTDMATLLEVEKLTVEMFGFMLRIISLINKQYPSGGNDADTTEE